MGSSQPWRGMHSRGTEQPSELKAADLDLKGEAPRGFLKLDDGESEAILAETLGPFFVCTVSTPVHAPRLRDRGVHLSFRPLCY